MMGKSFRLARELEVSPALCPSVLAKLALTL